MSQRPASELNAFTSQVLVQWIRGKLIEHGVKKVIPDDKTLEKGYRRHVQSRWLSDKCADIISESVRMSSEIDVPADLREQVESELSSHPKTPWDEAVKDIAYEHPIE